ncbi:MAG: glutamyl-tRNA reductase [Desulfococcaceae bacterium]
MVNQAVHTEALRTEFALDPAQEPPTPVRRGRPRPICPPSPAELEIVLLGLNHKTAEVELRECLGFSGDEADAALHAFRAAPPIEEAVLLSTCNRVEVLMSTPDVEGAAAAAKRYLAETKGMEIDRFEEALYVHVGDAAVNHIFRVAAGLDSLVVGEPQILGQLKGAYRNAIEKRTSGVLLNRLLHKTFFVAKRVRTETGIGDHAVSISYAATELARKIFGELEGKQVLLVGAGEMAELAVEHLIRHRAGRIHVANRTFERGLALADRFDGQAIRFEDIPDALREVDIIISSTGASGFVIEREHVRGVMRARKNRPLFFIDIAVPRDIDPAINRVGNAYVYDIDDLKDVIEENREDRIREARKAERIIEEAVVKFRSWRLGLDVVPTIKALREKLGHIAEAELEKTLGGRLRHLGDEEREAMVRMTEAMINKFLHDPTLFLKGAGCRGGKSVYLDVARKLFNLDDEGDMSA